MKIRDQAVDHAKRIAGHDEQARLRTAGAQLASLIQLRRRFERAQRGGTHRDNAPPRRPRRSNRINRRLRQRIPFTVHLMFGKVLHPDRLKGAGTDMQGQPGQRDATRL